MLQVLNKRKLKFAFLREKQVSYFIVVALSCDKVNMFNSSY